jgi:uncharacterized protein
LAKITERIFEISIVLGTGIARYTSHNFRPVSPNSNSNSKLPMDPRPPLPPFTEETAIKKVQAAEDAWNSRDPERVSLAYTEDTEWRNRDIFLSGRAAVVDFLTAKWAKEQDYRLKKTLWAFSDNRIAVRFEYEWHDADGQWWRSHGNENWEFDENGYMAKRYASINDQPIAETERKLR